ncbi:MAG: hypothetical protein N4A65_03665 [Cohaesibacter sp.]|jgi:DNA-binding NarL/FixJ family response regulator|nr:hypothetical protein [Cohaesibacter sp.]
MRRLKPIKDLSVLIVAPRRHDRQLWGELMKNCGINYPTSMADIKQAAHFIASGQADVVFVDESYGAQGIAQMLIPARSVEFAGGRGVCLVLCSKKATAADVLNARRLGFASLVILPASTDTIRKHLELAARYIPPSDEELGWSVPKKNADKPSQDMPAPKDDPASDRAQAASAVPPTPSSASTQALETADNAANHESEVDPSSSPSPVAEPQKTSQPNSPPSSNKAKEDRLDQAWEEQESEIELQKSPSQDQEDTSIADGHVPGRSGNTCEEEVVFL